MGRLRLGDHQQTRGVAVQAMDDPGPLLPAEQGPDRAALAEPVGERPIRVTRSGVDDQAGRLVDHREPLVLVHNHEIHGR
jgi:hypothetical protein